VGVALSQAGARITPDQTQLARGGPVIPRNLLAGIKAPRK